MLLLLGAARAGNVEEYLYCGEGVRCSGEYVWGRGLSNEGIAGQGEDRALGRCGKQEMMPSRDFRRGPKRLPV